MNDFKMTGSMNRYAEALNRLNGLRAKAKSMRDNLIFHADPAAALESIRETEAEIKRLEPEVDDLYCLAHFGKHRAELAQGKTYHWKPAWKL